MKYLTIKGNYSNDMKTLLFFTFAMALTSCNEYRQKPSERERNLPLRKGEVKQTQKNISKNKSKAPIIQKDTILPMLSRLNTTFGEYKKLKEVESNSRSQSLSRIDICNNIKDGVKTIGILHKSGYDILKNEIGELKILDFQIQLKKSYKVYCSDTFKTLSEIKEDALLSKNNHMLMGAAAEEMYSLFESKSSDGDIAVRAIELNNQSEDLNHGTRLFSPEGFVSCTKYVDEDLNFLYYCDRHDTPEKIDWESSMIEGQSIYKSNS